MKKIYLILTPLVSDLSSSPVWFLVHFSELYNGSPSSRGAQAIPKGSSADMAMFMYAKLVSF